MNGPIIENPGLRFGNDGEMFWRGRRLEASDLRAVLDRFADVLAFQLMAWWERTQLPLIHGVLPQSGVLAEMAGLEVLRRPLDFFGDHLEPESFFDDRLEAVPESPKPLPRPRTRFRFPQDTLAGELERRNASEWDLKAWVTYESRQREIEAYEEDARTFPERLAKARRHRQWMQDRRRLDAARALLASWERKLIEAGRLPGWEFLPPGPGLCYSPGWLKVFLGRSSPEASYDFARIREIQALDPIAIRRGRVGAVSGYLAFVFEGDQVALESPRVGNALYFFHRDWQELSRRPKAELRRMMAAGDPRIVRFCHTGDRALGPWLREHLMSG